MISLQDAEKIIKLARDAISSVFEAKQVEVSKELMEKFSKPQGVFVTITIDKQLRGCIGFVEPVFPLYDAIVKAAKSAAFEDPRFPRLQKQEFKNIEVEISVLTVPQLIKVVKPDDYIKRINIGKDGLIIRSSFGSGLLLPQVFNRYDCNPKQALQMTCHKAGLDEDAWRDLKNKIYKFQAQIFKEENGKVVEED